MGRPVIILRRNILRPGVRLSASHRQVRQYNSINYILGRNTYWQNLLSHSTYNSISASSPGAGGDQDKMLQMPSWFTRTRLGVPGLQSSHNRTGQIRKTEILKYSKINSKSEQTLLKYQFLILKIRNFSQVRVSLESLFLTF